MNPEPDDIGSHEADDMGMTWVMPAAPGYPGRPASRLGGRAGGDIGGEKGVEAGGRVIGDLAEADAAGGTPVVFDLDGADDQRFALDDCARHHH